MVRDRFTRKQQRQIRLKEVTERAWALISTSPRKKLRLLDLRRDGCIGLDAPADAINARNHTVGRVLGQAIHSGHRDVDGLLFPPRLTGAEVYAIFDRACAALQVTRAGALADHRDLPDVLTLHRIQLIVS